MPKPKPSKASRGDTIIDPRFSNFTTDPRFRLPSKKHTRTKIDKRFERMLKDEDFEGGGKVDRYGRKLSGEGKKRVLERLYVPDDEEDEEEAIKRELKKVDTSKKDSYDPARGGGFSSSESEDSDEDNDDEAGGVEIEETFPDLAAQAEAVEMGEVSRRFAVVNLDWDYITSADLMAVFSSFVRPGGKIRRICIYPSEFGKERMEREELEGPPKEIFAKKAEEEESEIDSENESEEEDEKIKKELLKEDEGQDFDGAALRQYQLERLRYYYAVVECSDKETAQNIYESTDGTEYLSSANFFDLRFIPDDTEFDDKPRDECEAVPSGYRPTEFVTDALQHSKVKLTWDMNPEEASRKDAINRAFTGSRAEIGENDLRAYLGSDSEEDEEQEEVVEHAPVSKKELQRQKMRAALGLTDEPVKKTKGPVGDMQVTFTAGLSSGEKGSIFENEPVEETTAERYVRLEKERKARRKEKAKAKREGRDPDAAPEGDAEEKESADLGFDDLFFGTDEQEKDKASKSIRKEERLKKREAKAAEAATKASERAALELLMADNVSGSPSGTKDIDHFDINEIARAEKNRKKKGKKGKGKEESKRGGLQEGFEMDVGDARFGKVFESHEFAIDPSHPRFKGTEGMKLLLEEGRRKREQGGADEVDGREEVKKEKKREREGDLGGLVEKVKKKAKR